MSHMSINQANQKEIWTPASQGSRGSPWERLCVDMIGQYKSVRLVVEHGNHCNTCVESSETRDITCYRRRFHVERARPLVNVWRFTAPTTHLN
jgi:hypothetical protein